MSHHAKYGLLALGQGEVLSPAEIELRCHQAATTGAEHGMAMQLLGDETRDRVFAIWATEQI